MNLLNALGLGITAFIAAFLVLDYAVYPIMNKLNRQHKMRDVELGILVLSGMIGAVFFLFAL